MTGVECLVGGGQKQWWLAVKEGRWTQVIVTSIDKLRGAGRDEALQRALGLTEINDQTGL